MYKNSECEEIKFKKQGRGRLARVELPKGTIIKIMNRLDAFVAGGVSHRAYTFYYFLVRDNDVELLYDEYDKNTRAVKLYDRNKNLIAIVKRDFVERL